MIQLATEAKRQATSRKGTWFVYAKIVGSGDFIYFGEHGGTIVILENHEWVQLNGVRYIVYRSQTVEEIEDQGNVDLAETMRKHNSFRVLDALDPGKRKYILFEKQDKP